MDTLVLAEWIVCGYNVIACLYISWQAWKIRRLWRVWKERVEALGILHSAVKDALILSKDLADFLVKPPPRERTGSSHRSASPPSHRLGSSAFD